MFEVSHEVRIPGSPREVWRVITDLPGYRTWTRAILVDGRPEVGATLNYQIAGRMRSGPDRAIRFESTVKSVVIDRELTWTSGFPGIVGLRFGFALHPLEGATEVRHYLQVSGLLAHLLRFRLTRLYGPVLEVVTVDLARYLSRARLTALRPARDIRRRRPKR